MKGTFRIASLAMAIAIAGCGGGGGSSGDASSTPSAKSSVDGAVTKGPVAGATLYLYSMDATGNKTGDAVAGPITTAADGSWSVTIPDSVARPLLIEASGGTYEDEATGATVNAGSLNSFLPAGAETAAVTPVSELLVRAAREHLAANAEATLDDGVNAGRDVLDDVLGVSFDPLTTVPATSGDDAAAKQYAAVLGGLSTQANTLSGSTDPFETVIALIEDASDGVVDGKKDGSNITIGDNAGTLPDTSSSDLVDAINDYASENEELGVASYTLSAAAGSNGSVSPASVSVLGGATVDFTITPDTGYSIDTVTGCDGDLEGGIFTTDAIEATCSLSVSFVINEYEVSTASVTGGAVLPGSALVDHGDSTEFEISIDEGYDLLGVEGCGGSLEGTTYTTGAITAACTLTPSFALKQYAVTTNVVGEGSFDPDSLTVGHGQNGSLTLTAMMGYQVDSVAGDTCEVAATGQNGGYTVGPVTEACQVEAVLSLMSYTVTAQVTGNGTASQSSATVEHGSSASFTLTPDEGHQIGAVGGTCGGSLEGSTYTTAGITGNCSVAVTFDPLQYQVTTIAANGSFSPANPMVNHGDSQVFTVTADEGYQLTGVTGCGGTLEGNTFTTSTITAACSVEATFEEKTYTVTATVQGDNGMISGENLEGVGHGDVRELTVTPSEGYEVNTISGCGGSLNVDGTTYTTGEIVADCEVVVSFVEDGSGPTGAFWNEFNWDQANWQ
ncbi:hypothetical protein Q670_14575 [Alcanivorax sp. P2S70]|uniref:InlB B-repeat-containing protein n=1 Tax=Alcanivorax sp. P2S70 TaxID=1397527 RepID=UPI0003B398BA|nr:hypothetical protein [Alcanivorax sp. P2S70]ERP90120.1 hypothetical protein Q670_14575 [Alcanivorax sp. P2S70]